MIENCLRLLEDRIDKLKADVVLHSVDQFENPKLRSKFVNTLLKAMKEGKYDIRRFNFAQLGNLIELVSQYQKADLHVFFKYALNCIEQDIFAPQTLRD
jgi:hypothetical protein